MSLALKMPLPLLPLLLTAATATESFAVSLILHQQRFTLPTSTVFIFSPTCIGRISVADVGSDDVFGIEKAVVAVVAHLLLLLAFVISL